MNYIKRLQQDLAEAKAERAQIKAALTELKVYLASSKFQGEDELAGYVNINDVLGRLPELLGD